MKNLNSINIEKYNIDNNKLINKDTDFIYRDEQNKQNNHASKIKDFNGIKESFKYNLEDEEKFNNIINWKNKRFKLLYILFPNISILF